MELNFGKRITYLLFAVFISISMIGMAEAGGKGRGHGYGHGKGHGAYHHYRGYVAWVTHYLSLDETQVAKLQAVVDLKKEQKNSDELKAAKDAVAAAATAEVFSTFNYTEAVAALNALIATQSEALAAVKAVFLESLSAEQRVLLGKLRVNGKF